ncbi:MAG: hypothetical protein M1499_06095 [Firmicutes bacterium]|nr:hypothetical protein [Bacillota bacterium]
MGRRGHRYYLLTIATLTILGLSGCGSQNNAIVSPPQSVHNSTMQVKINWAPNPLVALKNNHLTVTVNNSQGHPISQGVSVSIRLAMIGMSMPPTVVAMHTVAPQAQFTGQVVPVMAGPWALTLTVNHEGHHLTQTWNVLVDN